VHVWSQQSTLSSYDRLWPSTAQREDVVVTTQQLNKRLSAAIGSGLSRPTKTCLVSAFGPCPCVERVLGWQRWIRTRAGASLRVRPRCIPWTAWDAHDTICSLRSVPASHGPHAERPCGSESWRAMTLEVSAGGFCTEAPQQSKAQLSGGPKRAHATA
jgi:hypothetical protein